MTSIDATDEFVQPLPDLTDGRESLRFPSSEIARLTAALEGLLIEPELGRGFLVWLQEKQR
jgi:hypothetical protein